MWKYVIKRILLVIPIVFGVLVLVFVMMNITPGDPARNILGIAASQEAVDALNHELGYDLPLFQRLINYLKDIFLHFDFGESWRTGKSVVSEIAINFKYTFKFSLMGAALYVIIGIPLGVMSAVKQYSVLDNISRVAAMCIAAFPGFWLGMVSILVFSLRLELLPSHGVEPWTCYILPVAVVGVTHSASLMRLTRTTMLEAIRQDYVRTARAKGASERSVIWKHAFKNAMLPIIMTVGVSFGAMMGGTVLLETIFDMPGLGTLAYTALNNKDIPLVMGTTLFLAAIFCLMVVVVDIISALVDPRVRAKYTN